MKRLTDLQHDVKNVQDNVLGDLDADDRVRMFLKAAAGDQDDRIEMLRDSAPRYEYETRDLEFTHGAIEAFSRSSNYPRAISPSTSTGTPTRRRHGLTTTDPSTTPTSRASPGSTASCGNRTTSS
jgi:hypothetical protein